MVRFLIPLLKISSNNKQVIQYTHNRNIIILLNLTADLYSRHLLLHLHTLHMHEIKQQSELQAGFTKKGESWITYLSCMRYKIHLHIIDVQIYSKDVTNIFFDKIQQTQIEISSGIRQRCNGSTILFILITHFIIEKIYNK